MDLRQLRYFSAAVKMGSISAAARECGISQPSLSQQVKILEDDLGEILLIRQARGVAPTEAGKVLMMHTSRLLAEEKDLRAQFDSRSALQAGQLKFGIIPTMAPYLLPKILGPFRQLYPGITVSVTEARTGDLIECLSAGSIEFAILSDIDDPSRQTHNLETQTLFKEKLVLAVHADHSLASRESEVTPQELPVSELIHLQDGHCLSRQTLTACRLTSAQSALRCDQLDTALAMVNSGLGIAVVPSLATQHGSWKNVRFVSFSGPQPERDILIMTRKQTQLAAPAEALAQSLRMALNRNS